MGFPTPNEHLITHLSTFTLRYLNLTAEAFSLHLIATVTRAKETKMKHSYLFALIAMAILIASSSVEGRSKVLANPWIRKCYKTSKGVRCTAYVPKFYQKHPSSKETTFNLINAESNYRNAPRT